MDLAVCESVRVTETELERPKREGVRMETQDHRFLRNVHWIYNWPRHMKQEFVTMDWILRIQECVAQVVARWMSRRESEALHYL